MSGAHVPTELLERFAEGDVEDRVAVEIARHLDACSRCATRAAALEPLSAAFASVDDPELPRGLVSEILQAVDQRPRATPEPAIAAGLMALAFLLLLFGGAPADLVIGAARAIKAIGTASRVLLEQALWLAPYFTVLTAILLAASAWLARSIELQRRSA